ncbi:hypothetical protein BC827DRAFT_873119 [Russula dissimulans]|nr:hypothetical protein BC827DRAFT_873119 [Russula dissimulans]
MQVPLSLQSENGKKRMTVSKSPRAVKGRPRRSYSFPSSPRRCTGTAPCDAVWREPDPAASEMLPVQDRRLVGWRLRRPIAGCQHCLLPRMGAMSLYHPLLRGFSPSPSPSPSFSSRLSSMRGRTFQPWFGAAFLDALVSGGSCECESALIGILHSDLPLQVH